MPDGCYKPLTLPVSGLSTPLIFQISTLESRPFLIFEFPLQEKHDPKLLGHPFLPFSMVYQLSDYLILDDMVWRCGAELFAT